MFGNIFIVYEQNKSLSKFIFYPFRVLSHVIVDASVAGSPPGAALPYLLRAAALLAVPARLHLQAPPLPRPQERQTLEVSCSLTQ